MDDEERIVIVEPIGSMLRTIRLRDGTMSLRELARKAGLAATYLSGCETGRESPSERILRIYADHFGVDFDSLCKIAGRVPSDVAQHLVETPGAFKRVRREMSNRTPRKKGNHGKEEEGRIGSLD